MTYRLRTLCAFTLLTAALAAFFSPAFGATSSVDTTGRWDLYRGTVTTRIATGFGDAASCRAAALADAELRQAAAKYWCRAQNAHVVTYTAPTTPPPPPPPPPSNLPPGVTVASALPAGYVQCGAESYSAPQTCSSAGPVFYGAGSKWHVRNGPLLCNNIAFGDPVDGVLKTCHQAGSATPPPPPVEPPPVEPPPPPPASGDAGPRVSSFTASGPITAATGQTIAGLRISNVGGNCITIPQGVSGVTVRDSEIGPCGGDASVAVYGSDALVEHVRVTSGARGVLIVGSNATLRRSKFEGPFRDLCERDGKLGHCSHAIEVQRATGAIVEGNVVRGTGYQTDAVSMFESNGTRLVGNDIDVDIVNPNGAAFTMGDSTTGSPGSNNYVAGNVVRQTGGVPAGVFGSNGNTVLEKNCLTAGIQAYNYSGIFVGVTVRQNVINMAASFVPDSSVIAGWSTNIDSTDCSRVPQ